MQMVNTCASISYIHHQANQSADHLARLGAEQARKLVVTEETSPSEGQFELEDGLRFGHLRV